MSYENVKLACGCTADDYWSLQDPCHLNRTIQVMRCYRMYLDRAPTSQIAYLRFSANHALLWDGNLQ